MTVRLTVAQALVRFLASQYTERDGMRQRLVEGCWGIFGHGNVAGVGQALLQAQQTGEADLKYYMARNEQAMVHASVGFARMRNRLATFACTASIGPGSTNMVTGAALANAMAREADVVLGVGTRYSDFTTASRTAFGHPDVRFVNLNVAAFDAGKQAGVALVADARAGLEALTEAMRGYHVDEAYTIRFRELNARWRQTVDQAYHLGHRPLPAQTEILGTLNEFAGERDVVVQAAGSMPGDLQMLWRARDPKQYHVEYGYSCMGYEIAGGLGAKLADPGREVFVLVGDGSYLMMAQEIVTAVSERIKLTIVLVQNQGFGSIGSLSESLGSQRFGTRYRYRDPATGRLDGDVLPVDLAANAASLGADVLRTATVKEFARALEQARASDRTTVVYIETDPLAPVPSSESWWDVPVSETSALESTQRARAAYEAAKRDQRLYL